MAKLTHTLLGASHSKSVGGGTHKTSTLFLTKNLGVRIWGPTLGRGRSSVVKISLTTTLEWDE